MRYPLTRPPVYRRAMSALAGLLLGLGSLPVIAQAVADEQGTGPVQVYILSGQSNMVGIGQVDGGGSRWGGEMIDPVVSVYPGEYDPEADYDAMQPNDILMLDRFGGVEPTPYPGGGTQIVRGFIEMRTTGVYEFRPGYDGSTHNIMEVNGQEVHRKEPGGSPDYTPLRLEAGDRVPFKITYLTDDADGLGWTARTDIPGTLRTVVHADGLFPYLLDEEGGWATRDDVWYRGVVTATADKWLTVGCGAGGNNIGPELGFGHVIGEYHDQPVLILKASQGNRSLGWDFLPPGSERFEHDGFVYAGYGESPDRWAVDTRPEPIGWYAGKQYDDCFAAAREVLADFDENFPQWAGRGYEIAGFVWWQGHKDQGSDAHTMRYEQNLVQLINVLREAFDAPDAPFVIATIGFGGWSMDGRAHAVANAQLAVSGTSGRYPQFVGNVLTVETRDFWRPADRSPRDQGFHYNQNAETYMRVGEALGEGMVELLEQD